MREIKFKAYDPETEEWYYSDKEYGDHWFEFKDGTLMCFGIAENPGTIHEPPYPESYECEDVLQYTGQKDNKRTKEYSEGQKVYEDDIVYCGDIHVIEWDENDLGWILSIGRDGMTSYPLFQLKNDIEIIGNKQENPELIAK